MVDSFYVKLIHDFDFNLPKNLLYILAGNVDEAKRIIGFDYTYKTSFLKQSGLFIYPNVILSSKEDHFHEIVHSIFYNLYQNAPMLFQEGVATYLGGALGLSFDQQVEKLKQIIAEKPDIDFGNFDANNKNDLANNINLYYSTGALLMSYAHSKGGTKCIKELFEISIDKGIDIALYEALEIKISNLNNVLKNYINEQ